MHARLARELAVTAPVGLARPQIDLVPDLLSLGLHREVHLLAVVRHPLDCSAPGELDRRTPHPVPRGSAYRVQQAFEHPHKVSRAQAAWHSVRALRSLRPSSYHPPSEVE